MDNLSDKLGATQLVGVVGGGAYDSTPKSEAIGEGNGASFSGRIVKKVEESDFQEFPSIFKYSEYAKKIICEGLDLDKVTFAATEKINGVNFSFYTRGGEVRTSTRKGFIPSDRDFNESEKYIGFYRDNVKRLYDNACEKNLCQLGELLIVTGEYYGPSVKLGIPSGYPVNGFSVFSIRCHGKFLDYDQYRGLAKQADIPCVPEVIRGNYFSVIDIKPNDTKSCLFGAAVSPPVVEGVVIQTTESTFLPFVKNEPEHLVILKNKSKEYSEEERQTRKKGSKKLKIRAEAQMQKGQPPYSQELSGALISKLVDSRVNSLMSKGMIDMSVNIDESFCENVRGEIIKDVIDELIKDPAEQNLAFELEGVQKNEYKNDVLMTMMRRKAKQKLSDSIITKIFSPGRDEDQ